MEKRGKLIIFEGIGGAGKTEGISKAADYLNSKGFDTRITREPGGIQAAEEIRELIFLLKKEGVANPDHQLALFFAARYILLKESVIPSLERGTSILLDRYGSSTNAYQGWAEGGNLQTIADFNRLVTKGVCPDATILLRVSAEIGMARKASNDGGDPFDREGLAYQRKLVAGYDNMAKNSWGGCPWYVVNAEGSRDSVTAGIWEVLNQVFLV